MNHAQIYSTFCKIQTQSTVIYTVPRTKKQQSQVITFYAAQLKCLLFVLLRFLVSVNTFQNPELSMLLWSPCRELTKIQIFVLPRDFLPSQVNSEGRVSRSCILILWVNLWKNEGHSSCLLSRGLAPLFSMAISTLTHVAMQ